MAMMFFFRECTEALVSAGKLISSATFRGVIDCRCNISDAGLATRFSSPIHCNRM